MAVVPFLYHIARAAAWIRAGSALLQGNAKPLARRVRNRFYFELFGKYLR